MSMISLFRRIASRAGLAAGGWLLSGGAWAVTGLHQATLDNDAEILATFGGLWGIGEAALGLGFLLWLLQAFAARRNDMRTAFMGLGSVFLFFGSSSMFFSVLPAMRRGSLLDFHVYAVPAALALLSLTALFLSLSTAEGGGGRYFASQRQKPGFALGASLWLVFLIVLVAVPIACAWSLVWNRGLAGMPNMFLGIENLFGSRYWSLGCVAGRGACGSAVNSIALGIAVSALAGFLGVSMALYVHRANAAVRKWVAVLVCLPMITPPFLIGLGLAQVFGQSGIASVALESVFGIMRSRWFFGAYGVMIAQVVVFFPLAYFLVLNALDSLSRAQIDAAKFLGASDRDVLRTVVFPALRDPLAVAMLVVFVETLSDIGNPLIIGGKLRVLSTELFYSSSTELAAGEMTGVPALLLVGIAFGMVAVKEYLAARTWRCDAGITVMEGGRCELPAILRWISGGLLLLTVAILVTVYAMIGIGAFSEGGIVTGAFTLDNFARGFGFSMHEYGMRLTGSGWESLIASLSCAFLVAPVGGVVGMAMVWVLQRVGAPCARLVESISSYLLSVPSVVIGAGFLLAFGRLGLTNLGAWIMILLAMLIRNLAVCMRFGGVALRRMDSSQLEMSGLFGAGSLTTFLCVVAPMLRPAFIVCIGYGFVRSMTMLGSVLLLSSAENQVATTYMIDRIGIGEFGVGMAYGVVLAGCIGFVLAVGWMALSARKTVPGWGGAISDLKAAVVLAQKEGLRG